MLDGVSIDQLRTFLAAVDEGSFTAAGRKLQRAQSVVSQTLANLEAQLNVPLFDRRGRKPMLTEQGRALLGEARAVAGNIDSLKARAKALAGGVEPELKIVVDNAFPTRRLTETLTAFQSAFDGTSLQLFTEAHQTITEMVRGAHCAIGLLGSTQALPPELSRERLRDARMVTVAPANHPLARIGSPVPREELARHLQLVVADRCSLALVEQDALEPRVWRLSNVATQHAFLRDGLGWAHMPHDLVLPDLTAGTLVAVEVEGLAPARCLMPMWAIYRRDTPPGPAGRWLIDRLADGIE